MTVMPSVSLSGESCGEGTLVTLRQLLEAKGFEYSCYDVFGDPRNSLDIPALRDCAVDIITAAQQGTLLLPFHITIISNWRREVIVANYKKYPKLHVYS